MKKYLFVTATLVLMPLSVHAQTLQAVLDTISELVGAAVPIAVTLALILFIWGLAQYILKAGDEDGRAGARQTMIWGIIALFVIVSIWGLVELLRTSFGVEQIEEQDPPQVRDVRSL